MLAWLESEGATKKRGLSVPVWDRRMATGNVDLVQEEQEFRVTLCYRFPGQPGLHETVFS